MGEKSQWLEGKAFLRPDAAEPTAQAQPALQSGYIKQEKWHRDKSLGSFVATNQVGDGFWCLTNNDADDAVKDYRAALAIERERCARIVENAQMTIHGHPDLPGIIEDVKELMAAAIREGGDG